MFRYLKQVLLLILIPSFLISCVEEPANAPGTKEGVREGSEDFSGNDQLKDLKDSLTSNQPLVKPGSSTGIGSDEFNAKKEANASAPILYGVGAGNITMNTTLAESRKILTPPRVGPNGRGQALYDEALFVQWLSDGDRTPYMIVPTGDYDGGMQAGSFGELNFQSKFLNYEEDGQEGAVRLTRELFVELEQFEDKSYNCLATARCQLIYGGPNDTFFVIVLPGAVFLMSRVDFQIAEIRIIRDIDPFVLNNDLDMMSGSIIVPNDEPVIDFGSSFESIDKRFKAAQVDSEPYIFVNTRNTFYSWNGVALGFFRTNFSIDVKAAEPTDQVFATRVEPEFSSRLTINGQPVLMIKKGDDLAFALETQAEAGNPDVLTLSEEDSIHRLKMNTGIPKRLSMTFAKTFANFLSKNLEATYDKVRYRVTGFQNDQVRDKRISVGIEAWHSESLQGVVLFFQVNEEQERLSYLGVEAMDPLLDPFSKLVMPASEQIVSLGMVEAPVINKDTNQPVMIEVPNPNYEKEKQELISLGLSAAIAGATPQKTIRVQKMETRKADEFTGLSGFQLNDLIQLEDIDALGRNEATATVILPKELKDLGEIKGRVQYTDRGNYMVPDQNGDEREVPQDQGFVFAPGATLGVKVVASNDDQSMQMARVVSITSSSMHSSIQDVCGLGDAAKFEITMTTEEAEATLNNAIDFKKTQDANFECNHFKVYDSGSLGQLRNIYFPDQNIKFYFGGKSLESVSIYLPLSKVKPFQGGQQ